MCIVGGGGWAMVMIVVPTILLIRWAGRRSHARRELAENFDPAYPQYPYQPASTSAPTYTVSAWTCLKPNCRRQNAAGAQYCGRCGATRGHTYRVENGNAEPD